jgi:hypothetical protein
MLRQTLDILTWKQMSDMPSLLRTRYEDHLEVRLQQVAAENNDALCILESLEMLPRDRRRAFLRAPQVASRLVAYQTPDKFDSGPVAKKVGMTSWGCKKPLRRASRGSIFS